ncbi:4'-phosphopantetheinyl transferase superfamily protein [Spirosoma sp. BT702]|uniref:4'-phosphopantetheinyl transferase superfamily protein n=1 Tax=Spirosoma profusum TaxID=2771354 RepID=A0A926Y3N9_9BACT|nr:4'-phosphopantetheinyl transferase superfamily protein [Spirosoma profusum]MBD2704312.1 4'-phosphopantetheinyl transferase superfamily protein [Spirosoma profusum]
MYYSTVSCASIEHVTWLTETECHFDDDVAVFRFRLPDTFSTWAWEAVLSPDERVKAERYYRLQDRQRFSYARGLLRILAGKYTDQSPNSIQFTLSSMKKPELSGATGWHINVSHAGQWVLLAFAREPVGVDIEQVNDTFSWQDIVQQSFSRQEQEQLAETPDARHQFYELWTRKEALLKATGKGLDDDFAKIPSLKGIHSVRNDVLGETDSWSVLSFPTVNDYLSAVAYRPRLKFPKFFSIDSGYLEH